MNITGPYVLRRQEGNRPPFTNTLRFDPWRHLYSPSSFILSIYIPSIFRYCSYPSILETFKTVCEVRVLNGENLFDSLFFINLNKVSYLLLASMRMCLSLILNIKLLLINRITNDVTIAPENRVR